MLRTTQNWRLAGVEEARLSGGRSWVGQRDERRGCVFAQRRPPTGDVALFPEAVPAAKLMFGSCLIDAKIPGARRRVGPSPPTALLKHRPGSRASALTHQLSQARG